MWRSIARLSLSLSLSIYIYVFPTLVSKIFLQKEREGEGGREQGEEREGETDTQQERREREARAGMCVCVSVCVCARACAYLDVAHLHCFPTLFEVHKVRSEGAAQGLTETSVLQEHRWAPICHPSFKNIVRPSRTWVGFHHINCTTH